MIQEKALARALPGSAAVVNFTGTWKNELGSEMEITQSGFELAGEYRSAVSSSGSQAKGQLKGYANGDLISVVVHWNDFQAITAWVGQLDKAQTTLNTLWQMTKQVDPGDEWASINAGADYFSKVR